MSTEENTVKSLALSDASIEATRLIEEMTDEDKEDTIKVMIK